MASEIVGRDEELEALDGFLGRQGEMPRCLVLEGEPGIGKSTLWRVALSRAEEHGIRALSSRPAEAERGLAFAGLGDLVAGVVDEVLPELVPPRRQALAIALLLEEATERVDPRAVGVAVQDVLRLLASEEPLLVAIDDVQWLDAPSAGALAFALRRLRAPVAFLLARRLAEGLDPSPVEQALPAASVERRRLGPLSAGAIQRLLQDDLGRVFARPTLLRIHEASGGNPLFALEVASTLGSDVDPTRPLPVPESLEGLVRARLAGLPESTRAALVLAAALGTASLNVLGAAGVAVDALEPALDAGILERANGDVRFTHPLLSSVLYQDIGGEERRKAHRALARVVVDPLERARHLALAAERPDPAIASVLDEAAALATARGAAAAAAELGEHAIRLTSEGSDAELDRRTAAAARAHSAAGEVERGRVLARELLERASPGITRAEALCLLAELYPEDLRQAVGLLRDALREPGVPDALQASVHRQLSLLVRFSEGLGAAERHARAALELADRHGDRALRAAALAGLGLLRFNAGKRGALRLAEQGYSTALEVGDRQALASCGFALAHVLVWSHHLDRARTLLHGILREWSERDERTAANAFWYLALVELRAGRLSVAGEHAERARTLFALYASDETEAPPNFFPLALVAAHRGDLGQARLLVERICELADLQGVRLQAPTATLAVIDLWGGDPGAAVERFAAAERLADAADAAEPSMTWWRAEQIEALLELGRIEDAVARLDTWEADGRRLGRDWALAHATRCRGLVESARGDVKQAVSVLEAAVARHEAVGDPVGRARALLALGVVRRRLRQKRAAREAIDAATLLFEECGARRWAEQARSEAGRIGGRRLEEGLTAAERRVAALVAEGRTNREVAAALFLGERTVESHLSRIYAKLGLRSRTELARVFEAGTTPADDSVA